MAWFRRNKKDEDTAPPEATAPKGEGDMGAPGRTDDTDVIRQERPSTGDWMAMPAMATTGPIQPTFRVQTLPDILTSHHSPAVSGSLGHAVSADAPSGTVSGLALYAGARSSSGATDAFTLRTPHPPGHDEDVASLAPARPLASVADEALPVSTLPEPAVSRSASHPLPLASPVTAGRDVPVARVIDAPSSLSPPAPTSTASTHAPDPISPTAPTAGDAPMAPEASDHRVGGFDLSALDPVTDAADSELLTRRPDDLAPPIQPRTLQRRTTGARPIEVAPHLRAPSSETAAAPSPATATAPLVGADERATTTPGTPLAADLEQVDRVDNGVALPLHAPSATSQAVTSEAAPPAAVQRRADDSSPESFEASKDPVGDANVAADLPPVAAGASPVNPREHVAESNENGDVAGDVAPLTGHRPLADAAAGEDSSDLGPAADVVRADPTPLPLVAPRSATAASGPDAISVARLADPGATAPSTRAAAPDGRADDGRANDESTAPAPDDDDTTRAESVNASGGPSTSDDTSVEVQTPDQAVGTDTTDTTEEDVTVSTLGALAPSTSAQPLTSTGASTRAQIGPPAGALPLAPADWQENLEAPAGRTPTSSAGSTESSLPALQRQAESSTASASSLAAAPSSGLRTPMTLAATRPVGAGPGLASLATLAPATTSVAQRMAAAAAAPAATAATSLAGASRSSGAGDASGSDPLPATLARSFGGSPTTGGPSVSLRSPALAPDLPEMITSETLSASRPEVPTTDRGSGSAPDDTPSGSSQGFTLQRAAAGTTAGASVSSGRSGTSGANAMPLHTPASAIPTAADVAVSAGLAERGPDGTLRYANVPVGADPSVQREITVQRSEHGSDAAASGAAPLSVQPALAEPGPAETPGTQSNQDRAGDLADQARKLYPHIRTQLESDIRRQLEARNRANRPS